MPKPPNDERHRYHDVLPPEASPEDLQVVTMLHRVLATPQPPAELQARIRRLASTLRSDQSFTALGRGHGYTGRKPMTSPAASPARAELPQDSRQQTPQSERILTQRDSPRQHRWFRTALGALAAVLVAGLILTYWVLLPEPSETPAGPVSSPTPSPIASPPAALTASQLRVQLRYPLFIPITLPPGLSAHYTTDGPGPEALVSITFVTSSGETAFILAQAPADRLPPPEEGEPVTLPNGIVAQFFPSSAKAGGRPSLEWIQEGTHIVLLGGTFGREELIAIAGSLSPTADLVLLKAQAVSTPTSVPEQEEAPSLGIPGHLALALGNQLLIDGRAFEETSTIALPSWSPSGQWIAYRNDGERTVVVRDARGTQRISLADLLPNGPITLFAWSPTEDLLAVAPSNGGLSLYRPDAPTEVRTLSGELVGSLAWAPDGHLLAAVLVGELGSTAPDRLVVFDLQEGAAQVVTTAQETHLQLAGWWPDGQGLLYWEFPLASQSLAADGVPLRSLNLATGEVTTLTTMLADQDFVAWGPPGKESSSVLVIGSQGREHWTAPKQLLQCNLQLSACTPIATNAATQELSGVACDPSTQHCESQTPIAVTPEQTVTLFPTWFPSTLVAAINAPALTAQPATEDELARWVAARRLIIIHTDGTPGPALPEAVSYGVLQAQWVTSEALLVLQVPEPGRARLLWVSVPSSQVRVLADLSALVPDPPVDGHGAPVLRLDWIAAWHP
uniref:Anaphase-promoting complex subunit 4-like WD40 domain-containing protein n=1 Tax=Thermomicrobium roseum TaxID=500 RepID=A0A7C1JKH9_THERO